MNTRIDMTRRFSLFTTWKQENTLHLHFVAPASCSSTSRPKRSLPLLLFLYSSTPILSISTFICSSTRCCLSSVLLFRPWFRQSLPTGEADISFWSRWATTRKGTGHMCSSRRDAIVIRRKILICRTCHPWYRTGGRHAE